jgi:peptide deformylase
MALEVRIFGDPVLRSKASPVKSFDDSLKRLAREMLQTMREYEGAGLAGNQVGRLQRIFVAAWGEEGEEEQEFVLVNPEIVERSEETERDGEGCLSIPGIGVEVERPTRVRVSAQDLDGEPLDLTAEGRLARIFQHEIDHLDGVLIFDRIDREARKNALREWRERQVASRS